MRSGTPDSPRTKTFKLSVLLNVLASLDELMMARHANPTQCRGFGRKPNTSEVYVKKGYGARDICRAHAHACSRVGQKPKRISYAEPIE